MREAGDEARFPPREPPGAPGPPSAPPPALQHLRPTRVPRRSRAWWRWARTCGAARRMGASWRSSRAAACPSGRSRSRNSAWKRSRLRLGTRATRWCAPPTSHSKALRLNSARALFAAVLRVRGPTRRDARVAANDRHRRAILDRAAGQARQLQRQHASAAEDPCAGQALVDASRSAAARDVGRRHVSSACRGPEPLRWQRGRRLRSELPPVPCVPARIG